MNSFSYTVITLNCTIIYDDSKRNFWATNNIMCSTAEKYDTWEKNNKLHIVHYLRVINTRTDSSLLKIHFIYYQIPSEAKESNHIIFLVSCRFVYMRRWRYAIFYRFILFIENSSHIFKCQFKKSYREKLCLTDTRFTPWYTNG